MKHWRVDLILFFIIIFGAMLVGKLFFIQVVRGDFYKALSQGQIVTERRMEGPRGEIFFQNGESLAINMDWPLIFASPAEIKEKEKTAEIISEILNMDKDLILEIFQGEGLYRSIKKRLTEKEVEELGKIKLTGIHLGKEIGRYYPQETLASKVVGFLDREGRGQYGVEEHYDDVLRGKEDGGSGEDVFLTIDYSIQFMAEKLLREAKEKLDIEGGEIIVMAPDSGKIFAMADFPNFNPNEYSKIADFNIFQNGAIQKIFEPGSVFKPFTMAAALEEGKITPQTTYIDKGQVKIEGWPKPIYNYGNRVYGEQTMTNVLEKSINTGAVFAERQVGNNVFSDYVERFGFFEPTGIDLTGEIYSRNEEFKKGYEINFVTAAFGQGVEMTPINMARAFCSIANGGKLVKPYIVEKIQKNGKIVSQIQPEIKNYSLISSKTASQLTTMLVSVVQSSYAKAAQVPGYYIAGKTGTAQIAFSALEIDKKGYSEKTWQSFIGFAPAFNPKFLIMVKLNNPKTKTAEYSAVPIFHDLAKYIIDLWQIPPDYKE